MSTRARASIDDLYSIPRGCKAEIVRGEVVLMSPTAADPVTPATRSLPRSANTPGRTGYGRAVGDNKGFHVTLPNRESFSPDAAFYVGPDLG